VAIPYHEKAALRYEKGGDRRAATLHRKAIEAYEQRVEVADNLAKGDKALMEIPGLSGPGPVKFGFYPQRKLNPIPNEYVRKRWWGGKSGNERSNDDIYADRWKGPSPEEVATILKAQGLKHRNEKARFSTVTVLANLGEKEAVLLALSDSSREVRLAAAKTLASMRWAEGWAACYQHADEGVRDAVAPLFMKPNGDIWSGVFTITGLIAGLNSENPDTSSFCQSSLELMTGKDFSNAKTWSDWWKKIGDAQPGLKRTGGGIPEAVDDTVDLGTWWQGAIQHSPNPLKKSRPPVTFRWDGYVVVEQPGEHRFFVRNRGEGWNRRNATGRDAVGMFFPGPCVKLMVDEKNLIPNPKNEILDPTGGMRLDFSYPIRLDEGLHKISLEFEWRGGRTPGWWHGGQPVIRLYWSSEHFLREVIPADHLIHLEKGN